MKLHLRNAIVAAARMDMQKVVVNISNEHQLTSLELIGILTGEIDEALKYALRFERHGNYEKRSGEA